MAPMPAPESTTFADTYTPEARLIRAATPPDLDTLSPGDHVICQEEWGIEGYVEDATARGIHVRYGPLRHEDERVISRRSRRIVAPEYPEALGVGNVMPPPENFHASVVEASTEAFQKTWDTLGTPLTAETPYTPAEGLVPDDWIEYLPFPTLNPAQVQALPHVTGDGSAFIVAPTGAGKTVIGMLATLQEVKVRGGKTVWLVPQRSLTAELDVELEAWRGKGLNVVSLSGETTTDHKAAQEADLWVATTEKFEALCRTTSMKETIASIGTVVADEIHLLGDPSRGPILENLLARIRAEDSSVRLVGLSATAANADEVAEWLNSELVEITWRPTRQTHQVLTLPDTAKEDEQSARNAMCVSIVRENSFEDGSTVLFCGSKANVRTTALAVAASRGVDTRRIDVSDLEAVAEACNEARVGLHYSDWPHKKDAESKFRSREFDVLVATSTLAAGVNLPARVVVVRDSNIGPTRMEVSMVQQMFGRAGRAGHEAEGWAFLLTGSTDLPHWRRALSAGYTIRSGILDGVADHVLGEVVQGRVKTDREMETWWKGTLAYHQGTRELSSVHQARDFLLKWRFIESEETRDGLAIKATALGQITSKMMVSVRDAAGVLSALSRTPLPKGARAAEDEVINVLASQVWSFANAPDAPEDQTMALRRVLSAGGDVRALTSGRAPSNAHRGRVPGDQVVRAGLMLCARSPHAVAGRGRQVAGVNRSLLHPALYDSPRYLAWLAALAPMGLVPGWTGIVAADLGARVKHYHLAPPRGAGRLLRLSERRGGSVASNWRSMKQAGATAPTDGAAGGGKEYLSIQSDGPFLKTSSTASIFVSQKGVKTGGSRWVRASKSGLRPKSSDLVAAFNAKGDWVGTGWLDQFSRVTYQ